MCYAKPGPRCSSHARAELSASIKDYNEALMGNASDAELDMYKRFKDNATEDYYRTPEGIRRLRNKGMRDLADAYEAERAHMIQKYRASRASVADQEQWDNVEDMTPQTMVVYGGKVRVIEGVSVSNVGSASRYDITFTDGTRARSQRGSDKILLATPSGEIPLKTRDIDHQEAFKAALEKTGQSAPPKGDKVVFYARNAEGQEIAAILDGRNVRSKHGWESALMLREKMDEKFGSGAVDIKVMTTDPTITPQKIQSTKKFITNATSGRNRDSRDVELFFDRYAV